jgi:DNA polymerase-3 subunit gamma/tau
VEVESMSLALYRKYRPATFAEVFGQEHVTGPICQALDSGRIHHAYLFSGPRGCGKTSSARILARSMNCEQGPTSTPCGVCESCVALAPMGPGSLDVIEIDAASHGLVDDARDLRDKAFYAPMSSRFKIYVIDEAHMITNAAFNALLKVVEEPPPHVKFIFATTEPDKVLGTIKSRTFHYRFRLIPPQIMRDHLGQLCEREGITIDPLVLPLIVRAGAGSARDSQSILDQLAAGSGAEGISYDRALSLLGYTDAALLDEVVDAFAAGDGAAVFRAVDRVIEAGLEPRRFVQDLLERFRDLLVLDAVPDAADTGLLDAPADELARMQSQASRYGRPSLSRAADVMAAALVEMRGTTSPRLVLELACARVLLPGAASDTPALLVRLDRLERRLTATGGELPVASPPTAPSVAAPSPAAAPAAAAAPTVAPARSEPGVPASEPRAAAGSDNEPAPTNAVAPRAATDRDDEPAPTNAATLGAAADRDDEPAPAGADAATAAAAPVGELAQTAAAAAPTPDPPAPAAPTPDRPAAPGASSGGLDIAALRRLWDAVLDAVKVRSRTAHALMMSSQIESLEDRTLTLSFSTPTLATRFANDVADFVVEALTEVVGVALVVKTTSGGASVGRPTTSAAASGPRASSASTAPGSPAAGAEPPAAAGPPVAVIDLEAAAEHADPDEEVDIAGDEASYRDPADVALELLKENLGAQVIGEIDRT